MRSRGKSAFVSYPTLKAFGLLASARVATLWRRLIFSPPALLWATPALVSFRVARIVTRFIVIADTGIRLGGWTVADTQRSLFSKCLARRMHYRHPVKVGAGSVFQAPLSRCRREDHSTRHRQNVWQCFERHSHPPSIIAQIF